MLHRLVAAGMDAARLNFSHGSHEEYGRAIAGVRAASSSLGHSLAVIADLQGPKIRVGKLPDGGISLSRGQLFKLTAGRVRDFKEFIPISYRGLHRVVSRGDRILMDDGNISLKVVDAGPESSVTCKVTAGGRLLSRKGINLPGKSIPVPSLTAKDKNDLQFALQAGVDYVALSFVRSGNDIEKLRRLIKKQSPRPVKIIAKIEKHEAIRDISSIIDATDAIMIARGDLGVEIAPERVPYWQKEIIRRATAQAKTVITATQMLESMIGNPVPTRAEASDVANAVYDGTDCIMLSGETAVGRYPVAAVKTMHRIARTVETSLKRRADSKETTPGTVTRAISAAACQLADTLRVRAIVTPTSTGTTALEVSKHRPRTPVLALSSNADVVNQLALVWGIRPTLVKPATDTDDMFAKAIAAAEKIGAVRAGEKIVITAGVMVNVPGTTNLIKVHTLNSGAS